MEYDNDSGTLNFISGVIVGAVLGAGIALLTAPESGRRTRKKIRRVASDVRDSAGDRFEDFADDVRSKVDDAVQSARQRITR